VTHTFRNPEQLDSKPFQGVYAVVVQLPDNQFSQFNPRKLEVQVDGQWQPAELFSATRSIDNATLRAHVQKAVPQLVNASLLLRQRSPAEVFDEHTLRSVLACLDLLVLNTTMVGHLHDQLESGKFDRVRLAARQDARKHPGKIILDMIGAAARAWNRTYEKPANMVYLTSEQEYWLQDYAQSNNELPEGMTYRQRWPLIFELRVIWEADVFTVDRLEA
jgi:hypothetical protein